MADLALSVTVSRDLLNLPALECNSAPYYVAGTQFLGTAVQWNRQQITSAFLDGAVTAWRTRQIVNEQLAVEAVGDSPADLQANVDALVAAFTQASYTLTATVGGATYSYACEAADYQLVLWTSPRLVANQAQLVFTVPRQPVGLSGVA